MSIHPGAIVSGNASIEPDVTIGAFSIIHDNVELGEGTIIGSHCEIGYPTPLALGKKLVIGKNSLIRSHSVFYEGSVFGVRLVTGHRVTVRENTIAGENLQIGTLSDIQGHCKIGNYVRFHSNVHIGQRSEIGDFVWIFPYVVLTNDPHPPSDTLLGVTVGNYSVIATMTVILPGVTIGERVLVGAHSCLKDDAETGFLYLGSPAKKICPASKIKLQDGSKAAAYPWTKHFTRGYPQEIAESWRQY